MNIFLQQLDHLIQAYAVNGYALDLGYQLEVKRVKTEYYFGCFTRSLFCVCTTSSELGSEPVLLAREYHEHHWATHTYH